MDSVFGSHGVSAAKWKKFSEMEKCFSILGILFTFAKIVRPFYSSYGVKRADRRDFLMKTKKPMNLRMVHSKVCRGQYPTVHEFVADLRLIVTNAYRFLGKTSYRVKLVKQFSHLFEEAYAKYGIDPVIPAPVPSSFGYVVPRNIKSSRRDLVQEDSDLPGVEPPPAPVYEDITDEEEPQPAIYEDITDEEETDEYAISDDDTEVYDISDVDE